MKRTPSPIRTLGAPLAAALAAALAATPAGAEPEPLVAAFSRVVIPTSANLAGQNGSFFRTRVSILNVTTQSYTLQVLHYGNDGQTRTAQIQLGPGQIRNYDNFLEDVLQFSGAGAIVFNSLDDTRLFMVTAEVVNDVGNGKFKTVVAPGPLLEASIPDADNLSLGIGVDASTRTNLGVFNDSNDSNTVTAEVYSPAGALLTTVSFDAVGARSWVQQALTGVTVAGGYIRWRMQAQAFCWAVVVDNTSNDGTFLPAADVLR